MRELVHSANFTINILFVILFVVPAFINSTCWQTCPAGTMKNCCFDTSRPASSST